MRFQRSSARLAHLVLLSGILSFTCVYSRGFVGYHRRVVGSIENIQPYDSSDIASKTTSNQNKVHHTALSLLKRDEDDDSTALCDEDDDLPECQPPPQDYCDWTSSFRDLDTLVAANLSGSCADILAMQTLLNLFDDTIASYNNTNHSYDTAFGYYVKYIKSIVPQQLAVFMSSIQTTIGPGNKYFDCTYQTGGKAPATVPCPVDSKLLGKSIKIKYQLKNETGFYNELLQTYGIDQLWVVLGDQTQNNFCGAGAAKTCIPYTYSVTGFPLPAAQYTVPNPKDIVTAALPHLAKIRQTFWATWLAAWLGNWDGPADDIVQTQSTAVFMIVQAIQNMQQVKDIGLTEKKQQQISLILNIIGAVLIFIPFLGEGAAAATGITQLGRMAALIGVAGNTGLGVIDIVQNPASAPMAILGILLGAADLRNPAGFAEMGAARRSMSSDDVTKIGSSFKMNSDKLAIALNKACKVR